MRGAGAGQGDAGAAHNKQEVLLRGRVQGLRTPDRRRGHIPPRAQHSLREHQGQQHPHPGRGGQAVRLRAQVDRARRVQPRNHLVPGARIAQHGQLHS